MGTLEFNSEDPTVSLLQKPAAILGRVVLWDCFDPLASQLAPQEILTSRVQGKYERVHILYPANNPVRKVGLVVCGLEDHLFIDDLVVDGEVVKCAADDETRASGANATTSDLNLRRKRHSSELQVVLSQLDVMRKQNEVLRTKFDIMKNHLSKKLKYISDTMNQFAAIPATFSTRNDIPSLTYVAYPASPSRPSSPTNTGNLQCYSLESQFTLRPVE